MIERRPPVAARHQQARIREQVIPHVHDIGETLVPDPILLMVLLQQQVDFVVGGGRFGVRALLSQPLTRMHPQRHGSQPSPDLAHAFPDRRVTFVKDRIDNAVVELMLVCRQAFAFAVDDAHRGQQERIGGQLVQRAFAMKVSDHGIGCFQSPFPVLVQAHEPAAHQHRQAPAQSFGKSFLVWLAHPEV